MIQAEQNAATKASLEAINAENYFRALAYFRLVQNWGDVPYYRHVLSGNDEACSLVRTPYCYHHSELITDLENASEKLPASYGDKYGRATQVAALGFKAKNRIVLCLLEQERMARTGRLPGAEQQCSPNLLCRRCFQTSAK